MSQVKTYSMLINGNWVQASDGKTFESFNPATGEVWSKVPEATEADVNLAVEAAEKALDGEWRQLTPTQRGKCLHRLGGLLAENSEHLGRIETTDTGKMFKETAWQSTYIAEFLHFFAGAADKIHGDTLPIDKPDMFVFTEREPLGVIAAVIPWNSQMFLSATKIGPALAAGNTIVLKASEHASAPLLELSARHIIRNSANNFAEVSLELGGKSPFIVFDDANIESAVNGSVAGIFAATGQSCVAGSRLYLHEDIADEFLEKMVKIAGNIKIGDPQADETEMGPLCTQGQLEHIEAQVSLAQKEGGKLLSGGKRPDMEGLYFEPTIIDCPRQDMTIVDTELFGPVLSVQRFNTEEEAVALANDTKHGLAAGIFTRDSARSVRMAKKVKAGIVWVNTYRVISPIAEFGGMKTSGYGRESGLQALYDYTRPKTVWMNLSDEPLANPFKPR